MNNNVSLFTINDLKADLFTAPFNSANVATAIREFTEMVNTPDHQFNKYADDYSLWSVGTFDRSTGALSTNPVTKICEAKEVKNEA